jgi:hypothetical protein
MKNQSLILPGLLCAALIAAGGCGKQDATAPGTSTGATPSAGGAVEKAVATAQAQTEVIKAKAQEAITNVQAQAGTVTGQAQALIDQAKKLLGESKWSEALALLNKLSGQPLSADLQAVVQGLQAQAQQGAQAAAQTKATDEAAKAATGLLPK